MKINFKQKPIVLRSELRGAVARGWCHPDRVTIEMDSALAEAIVTQIENLLRKFNIKVKEE